MAPGEPTQGGASRVTTISPVTTVAQHLAEVMRVSPAALLSDFDGTLSPVAATPSAAVIAPGVAEALRALTERVDVVGIVTGRGATDAMAKVAVPDLLYVGNHGLEWFEDGAHHVHPAGIGAESALPDALREIEQELMARVPLDGVIFENKVYSASIHYRLAADPQHTGDILHGIVNDVASAYGLWVSPGKMVVELRPGERINKGSAVRRLAEERKCRSMAFLGDDVTDTDAFVVLHELRAQANMETCSVGVLTADTHPLVVDHSDYLLDGVTDVVAMLEELVHLLPVQSRLVGEGS
jgi:trehalose 6-phosphate phosphatase